MHLDKTDMRILAYLQENGKRSYSEISRYLEVSEGMVRSRINKMLDDGVFEFIIHTNPNKVGLQVQTIVGFSTQLGKQEEIARELQKFPEVRFVGAFSGKHDLIIQAYFEDNDSLVNFINKELAHIEGILNADVNVELKQYKDSFSYVVSD
ncbi:Lrp/AsnC family transcriptional regulator for asnA, asnC and gidA [Salibacterium salarium]|uniref:Lrp/AsnC family transcriptional regulator n=1 Tax=Salibacterium salarium TaxID=284579 RepID=UPI0027856365|nr:Lrp/AsnC family transcriptional regulator [Salibacterium salarium]MDQ0297612.1 Lrp/AsnC family transcriptional regulator for asnA, asnC and gidA [Salibacterium salarium]